jgi:bacteriocin biosynthesis cyclodehydratase domain-containing protein
LKPWYRISQLNDATVFSYGRSIVEVSGLKAGGVMDNLITMLDGNHNIDEILARFPARDRRLLMEIMELMTRRELLLDGPLNSRNAGSINASTFLQAAAGSAVHPNRGALTLESTSAGVLGPSRTAALARGLLSESGVQVITLDSDSQLPALVDQLTILIVAPASLNHKRLSAINLQCLESRTVWLPVLPFDGEFAVIGPIVVPWQTCCYECFWRRSDANSAAPGIAGAPVAPDLPLPSTSSIEYTLAGLCALTTLRWACDPSVAGRGTALTVHIGSDVSVTAQKVYRVPRCPACSGRPGSAPVLET